MFIIITFREYSEVAEASCVFQAELKNCSTSLMVVGTMAGSTPVGVIMLRRHGDEAGDRVGIHLRS